MRVSELCCSDLGSVAAVSVCAELQTLLNIPNTKKGEEENGKEREEAEEEEEEEECVHDNAYSSTYINAKCTVKVFYCQANATRSTTISVQHRRVDFHQATIDRCSSCQPSVLHVHVM